uniref:Olfactory receptor n=1 Tax=Chelydra serpentina TaxID=8475 RepID=A0A8C3RYS1_CHESE
MADARNQTGVSEFILLGFSDHPQVQLILFVAFASAYAAALLGNVSIITVICSQPGLHTPMYFFLVNLSLLDIGCVTSTVPQMLTNLLAQKKAISFQGCLAQMYFFSAFLATELLLLTEYILLAVMSYDRYVAICFPLHYGTIMSRKICILLVICSWIGGFLAVFIPTAMKSGLPFCGPNIINHFFCDSAPLLHLACSDIRLIELVDFLVSASVALGTLLPTVVSYLCILATIMKIPSTKGRIKAFSTCSSHFTIITIGYGTSMFIYVRPSQDHFMSLNKVASLMTTVVTPMLNPFIFSLRNQQVKEALRDSIAKCFPLQRTPGCDLRIVLKNIFD